MSKNILIVESDNDKYFIKALLAHLNNNVDLKIETQCLVDDDKCEGGFSEKQLFNKLDELKNDIELEKRDVEKVGIILDADSVGINKRIELINRVLKELFDLESDLKNINEFVKDKKYNVKFNCYITNLEGVGELETLLKELACKDSTYADCLDSWQECLKEKNKNIKPKDFDKFWIQIYQRYDNCNSKDKKQAGKKCNNRASLYKDIYDFNHENLNDLKNFLHQFN